MTSRREFLQASLAGGISLSALHGPVFGAGVSSKYKALVCVMLVGGMDSHDCVVPMGASTYNDWRATRSSILDPITDGSRARENFTSLGKAGQGFGLVPELSGLSNLYRRGELAVVANTGPLMAPTTRRALENKSATLPPRLSSHNDQRSIWQTMAGEGAATGWGGRMIDQLELGSDYASIALNSASSFVVGETSPGITLSAKGFRLPFGVENKNPRRASRLSDLLKDHLRAVDQHADGYFGEDVLKLQRRSYDTTVKLAGLLKNNDAGEDVRIKKNRLAQQLAMVAKLISIHKELGITRQVFGVTLSGFDTHRNQFNQLPSKQIQLAEALLGFQNALNAMGVAKQVTTFTASDFGRTLVSNPSGTDHGWGGHHFVIGGAVQGGRVVGTIPPYAMGHDLDWRRGAMIPTIAIEQYGGALGRWFGLNDDQLAQVFPNIGRFERRAVEFMRA